MTIGSCGCGNIEYCYEGEPINQVFCYCTECQRDTGSDKWFGLWIPKQNFKFTKAKPGIFTRKGSSGKHMHKNFCNLCGITLCGEVTAGNFYSVAASTLKQPTCLSPKMAIFVASAPKWAVLPDNVPTYDVLPPEFS